MSSSKGGSSQAEDVEVTRQDQDMISAYGKLNNKLAELKRIRSSKEVRGCNPSLSLFLSTLSLRHYLAPRMGTGIGESCEAPLVSAMSWRSFLSGNLIFEESNFFFLLFPNCSNCLLSSSSFSSSFDLAASLWGFTICTEGKGGPQGSRERTVRE